MNDALKIADHAAQQSDRWLFLAALIVIALGSIAVWRFIVADRKTLSDRLEEITERHMKTLENLATLTANNTRALEEVSRVIQGCHAFQGMALRSKTDTEFLQRTPTP